MSSLVCLERERRDESSLTFALMSVFWLQIFFQQERKKLMEDREKGNTPDDFDMASVSSSSDGDENVKRKRASLFQAIAQTIANRWKTLPPDERVKFEALAKEEMKKYRVKKDEYQQRMVRETIDSSGRAQSLGALAAMSRGQPGMAVHGGLYQQPGLQMVGMQHAPAPAVSVITMPQGMSGGYNIQDLLQRQAMQQQQFQAGNQWDMERLLALRALQGNPSPSMNYMDPMMFAQSPGGGLYASAPPQQLPQPPPPQQLSELPPDQLIMYLNSLQGGGGGGMPPSYARGPGY